MRGRTIAAGKFSPPPPPSHLSSPDLRTSGLRSLPARLSPRAASSAPRSSRATVRLAATYFFFRTESGASSSEESPAAAAAFASGFSSSLLSSSLTTFGLAFGLAAAFFAAGLGAAFFGAPFFFLSSNSSSLSPASLESGDAAFLAFLAAGFFAKSSSLAFSFCLLDDATAVVFFAVPSFLDHSFASSIGSLPCCKSHLIAISLFGLCSCSVW
mmetsp:Transcript_20107/g.47493  ORF Transcript_20107/g.47493 Transcript_20107/m.47493 type:complete len:213 (+) Transcript_20107:24-662(+)